MSKKYIDTEDFKSVIKANDWSNPVVPDAMNLIIDRMPAADVAEIRHGEWKAYADEHEICATEFECSCCRETFSSSELTDEEFFQMMKYCPHCGAKMCKERA